MDLVGALSAASQTLSIAKQLRELDGAIDQAGLRSQLLALQEAAFEARSGLLDAKEACLAKDEEIAKLKLKLKNASSGEACPICGVGSLKTKSVVKHPIMGDVGIQEKRLECDNLSCAHKEQRMHDPNGLLDKK